MISTRGTTLGFWHSVFHYLEDWIFPAALAGAAGATGGL